MSYREERELTGYFEALAIIRLTILVFGLMAWMVYGLGRLVGAAARKIAGLMRACLRERQQKKAALLSAQRNCSPKNFLLTKEEGLAAQQ